MKTHITLFTLFSLYISLSFASHSVRNPAPFILNTDFLDVDRNPKIPAFSQLSSLLQDYRDDTQIRNFLKSLRQRLSDEKAEHKGIIDKQIAQCQEESTFRTQAIEEAKKSAQESEKQITVCTTEKEKATGLKELADNALLIYNKEIDKLDSTRANQKQQYQNKRQKLIDVQDAIDKALGYVDEAEAQIGGLKAPEFVQLTNTLLMSSLRTGHSHMVLPVYSKLLQMHSLKDFNSDDIQELKNLLNTLKANSITAVEDLDQQDQKDEQQYNISHQSLDDLVKKLTTQSGDSDTAITNMETCIARETSVNTLANDKVTRNQDLLEKSEDMCQKSEDEYEEAERSRNKQQVILNALDAALSKVLKEAEPDVGSIIAIKQ